MMYVNYRYGERNMFPYTGCLYRHCVFGQDFYTFFNIQDFGCFPVCTQHSKNFLSYKILRRLHQADADTNLTKNLYPIKFHVLPTTKMKKTITHIKVLAKLIKLSYFTIIQSCRNDKRNYMQRYKSNLIAVLSLRRSFKRRPRTH